MGLDLDRWRRSGRRSAVLIGSSVLLLGVSGCSAELVVQMKRVGMLPAASDRANYMGDLWVGAWIASMVVGVLVWGLIFYAMFRFRRRAGNEVPRQTKYHLPMEVFYTLVPLLIIGVLFFYTVRTQNSVLEKEAAPQHTINVIGQQWSWTFNYMEQNGELGEVVHDVGTNEKIPDLYLPIDESVRFNLASADVIHSFWIPTFYFKLDVIPGLSNSFDVTPTRLGTFEGKCAELCGTYHASMIFKVHVVTAEEYQKHLRDLKAQGFTGELLPPEGPSTVTGAGLNSEEPVK